MATRMLNLNNLTSSIGASLSNPLRSKKKFHFEVTLTIQELLHCTFVSGVLFAKLHLKDGGSFNGTSHRNDVEHHSVQWDQDFTFSCKMYANASTMILEPCYCKISIRKETKGGKSYTKLGYLKINLAEFAGQGTKSRKFLLQSYNENKYKPDNSVLKVKLYLRQTSGDTVFKIPETKPQLWEKGDEDEGFHDDWLSMYSHNTQRTSNGSTMSSISIGTGGTWSTSSHGGSAGNLKSHDSFGEINKELGVVEDDGESGSEETIIGQTSSQVTVETISTNTTETVKNTRISPRHSPLHVGKRTISPIMNTRSQSASSIPTSPSLKQISRLSPSSPILEESTQLDPNSINRLLRRGSDSLQTDSDSLITRLQHKGSNTSSLEEVSSHSQPSSRRNSIFKVPQIMTSGSPIASHRKGGASVQPSRVTAVPGLQKSHQRQASMGVYHHSPSSLVASGQHRRHNSFSTSINTEMPYSETLSLHSTKTRISTLSTLGQSRVDTNSVIANLLAQQDLTPASDDDSETNLKLYIDKHGGGVTIAGHNLQDKYRFKEIDVSTFSSEDTRKSKHRNRHKTTPPDHSRTRSASDTSNSIEGNTR